MADAENVAAAVEEQTPDVSTANEQVNGDATAPKEDAVEARVTVTAEVKAPEGDGTAEAVVVATEENDTAGAAGKEKKRKSSSGVPEHKAKKLNKKKSMPVLNLDCKPGQYYWARLKGYPAWPSIIADEQMLPETLLATRPVSTEHADGSLREDFRDGGKNAKDRTYPVMFLSTNEFAWLPNTSLTKLDPEECKNKNSKLSKALSAAYDLALEQHDLDYFKNVLQQFQEETAAWEAEQRQRDTEAAEKAAAKAEKNATKEKKSRKSTGDGDVEMKDADTSGSSSKKRKKDAAEDDGGKAKKTPKITKLNAPKSDGDSSKKESTSKPKKKVTAPKADSETEQKPEMTEAEKTQAREKHVLYLRHRLQKAFLSSDSAPKEDEMAGMNEFFVNLESYEDLEPAIIRTTKIHKVLKAIIKLNTVPKDDEFHFKKRSQTMLEAWNKRMEANGEVASKTTEEKTPVTNGDSKPKQETDTEKVEPAKAEAQADEIDKKVEQVDTTELKNTTETEAGADIETSEDAKDAAAATEAVETTA